MIEAYNPERLIVLFDGKQVSGLNSKQKVSITKSHDFDNLVFHFQASSPAAAKLKDLIGEVISINLEYLSDFPDSFFSRNINTIGDYKVTDWKADIGNEVPTVSVIFSRVEA